MVERWKSIAVDVAFSGKRNNGSRNILVITHNFKLTKKEKYKAVFFLIFTLCLFEGLLTSISITSIIPILSTFTENESVSNYFLKDFIGKFNFKVEDLIILLYYSFI